jgi:hypothetical protein
MAAVAAIGVDFGTDTICIGCGLRWQTCTAVVPGTHIGERSRAGEGRALGVSTPAW